MIRRTPLDGNVLTKMPPLGSDEIGLFRGKTVPPALASSKMGADVSTDKIVRIFGDCIHDLGIELSEAYEQLNYYKREIDRIQDKSECDQANSDRKIVELNNDLGSYIERTHDLEVLAIQMAGKLGKISAELNQPIGEDVIVDFEESSHGKYVKAIADAYYMERDGKLKIRYEGVTLE